MHRHKAKLGRLRKFFVKSWSAQHFENFFQTALLQKCNSLQRMGLYLINLTFQRSFNVSYRNVFTFFFAPWRTVTWCLLNSVSRVAISVRPRFSKNFFHKWFSCSDWPEEGKFDFFFNLFKFKSLYHFLILTFFIIFYLFHTLLCGNFDDSLILLGVLGSFRVQSRSNWSENSVNFRLFPYFCPFSRD